MIAEKFRRNTVFSGSVQYAGFQMMHEIFNDGRSYFKRVKFGEETESEVKRLEEIKKFENRFLVFYNDLVIFPNGVESNFLRLETPNKKDGSIIVAVDHLDRLAVVKQFRYAARIWEVGFPRVQTHSKPEGEHGRECYA